MAKQYKLVVIGTGTAAMVAAMRVRSAGWSVAVTDFRPFGGTCVLRGCDPKEMLVSRARAADHARRLHAKGIAGATRIDWRDLIGFKVLVDEETDRVLGAHLLGPHGDEVINVFALTIRHSLTAEQVKNTIFAYPTGASDIGYTL